MVKLYINCGNRGTEYWNCASPWAGNLIAIGIMRNRNEVNSVEMVDTETGEILKTYIRG